MAKVSTWKGSRQRQRQRRADQAFDRAVALLKPPKADDVDGWRAAAGEQVVRLAKEFRDRADHPSLRHAIEIIARNQMSLRAAHDDLKAVLRLDLPRLLNLFGDETDLYVHPQELVTWLSEVVEMLDRIRKGLVSARGRGGPRSLSTVIDGAALRVLIEDCAVAFRRVHGTAQLPAGIKQPFGQFCWAVYEHAMAGDSPDKSYLGRIIRTTLAPFPTIAARKN